MSGTLDERARRRWCAAEACSHGRGGIAAVARVTGISRRTIERGLGELDRERSGEQEPPAAGRARRAGAGRRRLSEVDPTVVEDLERLVDPATREIPSGRCATRLRARPSWLGAARAGHELVDRWVLEVAARRGVHDAAERQDP